jgi:hypothetical protein
MAASCIMTAQRQQQQQQKENYESQVVRQNVQFIIGLDESKRLNRAMGRFFSGLVSIHAASFFDDIKR